MSRLDMLGDMPIPAERIRIVDLGSGPAFGEGARRLSGGSPLALGPLQEAARLCEPPLAGSSLRETWGLPGMETMSEVFGRRAAGLI